MKLSAIKMNFSGSYNKGASLKSKLPAQKKSGSPYIKGYLKFYSL